MIVYSPKWDLTTIPTDTFNSERARRLREFSGPVTYQKLKPCLRCGHNLNTTQRRKPCPGCGYRHTMEERK